MRQKAALVEQIPPVKDQLHPTSSAVMKPGQIFAHWKQIRRDLLWTLDQFSDNDLSNKPFSSSWSVGEILLHIASAEEGWFRYVVEGDLDDWPEYELDQYSSPVSIKNLLNTVHLRTELFLENLEFDDLSSSIILAGSDDTVTLGWIIWHVLEHEIHHRGELSLILGLLGRDGLDV